MAQQEQPTNNDYPRGRGYGHDYMRGGEVFGGYGYSDRDEYELRRGDLSQGGGNADDLQPGHLVDNGPAGAEPLE